MACGRASLVAAAVVPDAAVPDAAGCEVEKYDVRLAVAEDDEEIEEDRAVEPIGSEGVSARLERSSAPALPVFVGEGGRSRVERGEKVGTLVGVEALASLEGVRGRVDW